jgi:hypothetical protein
MVDLARSSWTEVDVGYAQFEFTNALYCTCEARAISAQRIRRFTV